MANTSINTKTKLIHEFHPDFLSQYDNFIFDMDGVLIHGTTFLHGIVETINRLRQHGKQVYFCTNNSTQHRSYFYPWFSNGGIVDTAPGHLYTAASTAASTIFNDIFNNKVPGPEDQTKILVIGQPGLIQEFQDLGLSNHLITLDRLREDQQTKDVHDMKSFVVDPNIKVVIAGLRVDFNWADCCLAVMIIRENKAKFYSTDKDATFPASPTRELPGCGAIINMIEGSCGQSAEAMGKPTKYMLDAISRDHPTIDLSRTLMTGDRLDTDVAFGNNFGIDTLLVFSGVVKKDQYCHDMSIGKLDGTITHGMIECSTTSTILPRPTYCADNITWLFELGGMKYNE